jgi:hypothetical protein
MFIYVFVATHLIIFFGKPWIISEHTGHWFHSAACTPSQATLLPPPHARRPARPSVPIYLDGCTFWCVMEHASDQRLMELWSRKDQVFGDSHGAADAHDRDQINTQVSALGPSPPYFAPTLAKFQRACQRSLPGPCAWPNPPYRYHVWGFSMDESWKKKGSRRIPTGCKLRFSSRKIAQHPRILTSLISKLLFS